MSTKLEKGIKGQEEQIAYIHTLNKILALNFKHSVHSSTLGTLSTLDTLGTS